MLLFSSAARSVRAAASLGVRADAQPLLSAVFGLRQFADDASSRRGAGGQKDKDVSTSLALHLLLQSTELVINILS